MRSKVKIAMHCAEGFTASSYYRSIAPVEHCKEQLAKEGIEIELTSIFNPVLDYDKYQAFIFHRCINVEFFPVFMKLKEKGKKIVWDFDDNYLDIPKSNPSQKQFGGQAQEWIKLTLEWADQITVTMPQLANALGHAHKTIVLPNLMDLSIWSAYKPHRQELPLKVIFAGGITHRDDVEVIEPLIERAMHLWHDRIQFIFVGYCHPEVASKEYGRRFAFFTTVPLSMYPAALSALGAHVNLAPLAKNAFNESKSPIRLFEGTLNNSVCIATRWGPYELLEHGRTGFFAESEQEWLECLAECYSWEKRDKIIRQAREMVEANWSWQNNKEVWLNFFRNLAN